MLNISHLLVLSFLDLLLRLRAAVFVNVVAMRGFMSDADNGHITLSPNNLLGLQRANYLFHAALNSYMDAIKTLAVHLCDWCWGFAITISLEDAAGAFFVSLLVMRFGTSSHQWWNTPMEDTSQSPQATWLHGWFTHLVCLTNVLALGKNSILQGWTT
jgi:hypothetical protein